MAAVVIYDNAPEPKPDSESKFKAGDFRERDIEIEEITRTGMREKHVSF